MNPACVLVHPKSLAMGMMDTDMFTLSMLHTMNANTVTNKMRYRLGAPRQSVVTSLEDFGAVNAHASSSSPSSSFPSPAVDAVSYTHLTLPTKA